MGKPSVREYELSSTVISQDKEINRLKEMVKILSAELVDKDLEVKRLQKQCVSKRNGKT